MQEMNRRLIFVVFAIATLLAMIQEWSVPVACLRSTIPSAHLAVPTAR
jgi:hypothetical protein